MRHLAERSFALVGFYQSEKLKAKWRVTPRIVNAGVLYLTRKNEIFGFNATYEHSRVLGNFLQGIDADFVHVYPIDNWVSSYVRTQVSMSRGRNFFVRQVLRQSLLENDSIVLEAGQEFSHTGQYHYGVNLNFKLNFKE